MTSGCELPCSWSEDRAEVNLPNTDKLLSLQQLKCSTGRDAVVKGGRKDNKYGITSGALGEKGSCLPEIKKKNKNISAGGSSLPTSPRDLCSLSRCFGFLQNTAETHGRNKRAEVWETDRAKASQQDSTTMSW